MSVKNEINKYLQDYHEGRITKGLGIEVAQLDTVLRYKQGQFNIINGIDNVGKTVWLVWYFLALSVKHNLKWCIYSGENKSGQLVKQLIQFLTGTRLTEMTLADVFRYELEIANWFTFVDNSNFYKSKDLLKLFTESNCDAALIDPFTGLNREFTHAANYEFLNECRHFCNSTKKTLYVNTHVTSEAARRVFGEKSEYRGYQMPPMKSESEGGQPFGNRVDDFITIHRLVGHPLKNYTTEIHVRKIKDIETGGKVTPIDAPIEFDYNKGLGFTCNGFNTILNKSFNQIEERNNFTPNINFYEPDDNVPF